MNAFFDTNILVAAVTADSNRSDQAVRLLNEVENGFTSILNLMELRSVLAKKKSVERDRIDRIENRITRKSTITFPDASDVIAANRNQSETLLYPMDALILAAADSCAAPFVSFDAELIEHGAIPPSELLSSTQD